VYVLSDFESGSMTCASYIWDERLCMRLQISIALLLALAPSLAFAKPRTATVHMRPQVYRDRTPKVRVRDAAARQGHASPAKANSLAAQGNPFQ
jgi:hypothetical protein